MWTRRNSPVSVGFFCPENVPASIDIPLPVFENMSVDYDSAIALSISQMFANIAIAKLTGDTTISIAPHSQLVPGAHLLLKLEADSSDRTVTFGTGIAADSMEIPAGVTRYLHLIFDGTVYALVSEREEDFAIEPTDNQSIDYDATIDIDITKYKTIVVVATLTGAIYISATIGSSVVSGAVMLLKLTADATDRAVTFGTGISGTAFTLPAGTTKNMYLVYNGSDYVLVTPHIDNYHIDDPDVQSPAYNATLSIAITHKETLVNVAELTGDTTISISAGSNVKPGAKVYITLQSDSTARDATLSTGFKGTVVAGTISKTKVATFIYDGTDFVHVSTQQID